MLTFAYTVTTRTGVAIACGHVEARTLAAAKAKVRNLPRVYPNDMIYLREAF
jgi:hypothetical protein